MTTEAEVMCPKCGGRTWDNRTTKRNPKAPDYKCRDKSCDGAVWPPKDGATPYKQPAAPAAKQPFSAGGPIPGVDAEHPELPHEKMDRLFQVYDVCLDHAHKVASKTFGNDVTDTAVAAMTATLFIAAKDALR